MDNNDHISLTRIINGGFNGYNDRTKNIIKGFKILYNNCENDNAKFNENFKKFKIDSCLMKIHFMAQVIHESGSFKYNVEQGSAAYLAKYDGWHRICL